MNSDPRLVFLECAAAKLHLVEACHQSIDLAFSELIPAFREIAVPPCQCEREILDNFARYEQQDLRHQKRIDAICFCVNAATMQAVSYLVKQNDVADSAPSSPNIRERSAWRLSGN